MVVDVENRDAGAALVHQILRGDGGVVQIAVAAHGGRRRVMARRAAQRERRRSTVEQDTGAGEGDVGAGLHGLPRPGRDRHAGIERVEPQLAVDEVGHAIAAQAADRPHQRQRIVRPPLGSPVPPRTGEEIDEAVGVDATDRHLPEPPRLAHLAESDVAHAREDHLRTARHLEARLHLPIDELGVSMMAAMQVRINREHVAMLSCLE